MCKTEQNNKYSILQMLLPYIAIFVLFGVVVNIFNHLAWIETFLFILFQIFVILFPGVVIVLAFRMPVRTDIELVILGYAAGYCSNILLYYILVPFGFKQILPIASIIIAIFSTWYLMVGHRDISSLSQDRRGRNICMIFIGLLFILELFTYCGANLMVPLANENVYYNDLLYWIGNTISLMKSYPPTDFRDYLATYNYHYFSSMQLAVISMVTSIKPMTLSLCYAFIQPIMLLVLGSYCMLRRCSKQYWLVILGMLGVLLTTGWEEKSLVTYTAHLYLGQFGMDVGVGFLFVFLLFMIIIYEDKTFHINIAILMTIVFAVMVGVKAPMAVIALAGMGMLCILLLCQKDWKRAFYYGIPILAMFLIVYFFVCNVQGYSRTSLTQLVTSAIKSGGNFNVEQTSGHEHSIIIKFLRDILLTGYYALISNPFCYVMLLLTLILKRFKRWDAIDVSCLVMCAVGIVISLKFGLYGYSQMYFMMASYPSAALFIVKNLSPVIEEHTKWKTITIAISMGFLFLIGNYNMQQGYDEVGLSNYLRKGILNYSNSDHIKVEADKAYCNRSMYEAYQYIMENTETDNVIATNNQSMITGAMTERYVVNQGIQEMFDTENYDMLASLKSSGIDYFLQNKEAKGLQFSEVVLDTAFADIVFENESTRIYKLK
ncbi:MAG: hypothetical protein RR146_00135 [Lachnospiraceae bacterium]